MVKDYNSETIFPWSLVEEIISILKQKQVVFATYAQFPVKLEQLHKTDVSFLKEYLRFCIGERAALWELYYLKRYQYHHLVRRILRQLPSHPKDWIPRTNKSTVILQHDADRQPYKTLDMMKLEQALNVVSSNFFFFERNVWDNDIEPYELDVEHLVEMERKGFEIGYHLNAYELADYDLEAAFKLIERDINWFRNNFNLKSFVPHGGKPGKNNLNNHEVPYEGILRNYTWCYNGMGIYSDRLWSDGNIYFEQVEDPREVAKSIQPGHRAVFLMHPQYYGDSLMEGYERLPVSKDKWWRELWNID